MISLHDYGQYFVAGLLANFEKEYPKFYEWSGSHTPERHHYGPNGLGIHTAEVIESSMEMANLYGLNREEKDLLAVAALFHDVGKLWDYKENISITEYNGNWEPDGTFSKAPHKDRIYHIPRSAIEWTRFNDKWSYFDQEDADAILHAILAHHGQRAWGSPVEPKTKIAWILHCCDLLSARLNEIRD